MAKERYRELVCHCDEKRHSRISGTMGTVCRCAIYTPGKKGSRKVKLKNFDTVIIS